MLRRPTVGSEPVAVGLGQAVERVQIGVQAVEVAELERTHGEVEAELDRGVDVLGAGEALLEHAQALQAQDRRRPGS